LRIPHLATLAVVFFAASSSPAGILTGPIINPANSHQYYLLTEDTWQASEAEAVALGGHLATINDAAEQDWIFSNFGSFNGTNRSLWIGLNDAAKEGTFTWISGEPVTYTHWLANQPDNNAIGGENYVHILRTGNTFNVTPGFWNDLTSPNSPYYSAFGPIVGVVEVTPEPGAVALVLVGGLVALGRRYRA
jgi:hypothetical protein